MSIVNPCFFDIETIATKRADYRDRVASTIKPPANMKKAETIAKWEEEEKENAINEQIEKAVFNGGLCHVAQIQFSFGDGCITVIQDDDESFVIKTFFERIEYERHISMFIGHYITGFDLRVLKQRSVILGIPVPEILFKAMNAKPWDSCVFDTMYEWAGSKDSVSMDNLCYYLGIESPKADMDGSMFGDHWNSGDKELCRKYGLAEIEALRKVYNKMRAI